MIADANDVTRWMYILADIKEGVKAFAEKRPPRFRDPKTLTQPDKDPHRLSGAGRYPRIEANHAANKN